MKEHRSYAQVAPIAQRVKNALEPYCTRIEIAGSIRRQENTIGDIEILCIPKLQADLFGGRVAETLLDSHLARLLATKKISYSLDAHNRRRWGSKQKVFDVKSDAGNVYAVELYIQPDPTTWGVNMMIRTGPASFSKRMVTPRAKNGLCPNEIEFRGTHLYAAGVLLHTPEEIDVFSALGVDWIEPKDRR